MLIAGLVPGLILAGLYIAYIVTRSMLDPSLAPVGADARTAPLKVRIAALGALIIPSAIIVAVLGSMYFGIATPTEAAAVGAAGAAASAALQRRLTFAVLRDAALDTLKATAMVLWITIGAKAFVAIFTGLGGADFMLDFIRGWDAAPWLILAAMLATLIFLGCFLDEIGIILLTVPVFLPIVKFLGFDPLWFGVLFLVTAQMAYLTPPFGYTLFYIKGTLPPDIGMDTVYRAVVPFFFLQLAGLLICAFFPDLVTWLPRSMIAR